jgi:glycosyltransferase involved in cell wall biosynthesis
MQNIVLALYEANTLGAYYSLGVDNYQSKSTRSIRKFAGHVFPYLNQEFSRRKVTLVPNKYVHSDWSWEILRTISARLGISPFVQDWFWEKSEFRLDERCSKLLASDKYNYFLGTEHSCLKSLRAAKNHQKITIINFVSPHHSARKKWVDPEYINFPELASSEQQKVNALAPVRDTRKDEEASIADFIVTNSTFTTNTLIEAHFDPAKIITVPLGGTVSVKEVSLDKPKSIKFVYAGPVSVRKGAHYLLKAWSLVSSKKAELHLYGIPLLPLEYLKQYTNNVFLHGSIPQKDLFQAYQNSTILVFPTLLDGFGMVVLESMANGLPVITTPNAGAADLIVDGKNGFLVQPRDVEALAEKIQWCLDNPEQLEEMRLHALKTAQQNTWKNFRKNFRHKIGTVLDIELVVDHRGI